MSLNKFIYIPQPESLPEIRQDISTQLAQAGWHNRQMDILLAIGEVLQNIIRYGFHGGSNEGHIQLELVINDDAVRCVITDTAEPSDPNSWKTAHRNPEDGGLGLALIKSVADDVQYNMLADGNQAVLIFNKGLLSFKSFEG